MTHMPTGQSSDNSSPARPRSVFGRLLGVVLFMVCFIAACFVLVLEATEPFGKPDGCTMCHEMQDVHDRWAKSSHFANDSGVQVECIQCHLPPREDTIAHSFGKMTKGGAHACVHLFGKFDAQHSRDVVKKTMPNERCTHCHSNLAAKSSTPSVKAVHAISLAPSYGSRKYACVSCHDTLHAKMPPAVEPKFYKKADNAICFDCHIYLNREKEPLIVRHQAVNVGCVDCHGKSGEHIDDESNETAPDIIFAKEAINMSCSKSGCHSEKKLKEVKSHKSWYAQADQVVILKRAAAAANVEFHDFRDKKYCTDCHGNHSIPDRNKKWDKKTRKLIWSDGYEVDPNAEPDEEMRM